ncbi:MAG: iron-containing redox enzyme family protein [Actinomycetota bacterium]|nr:iron-containing redox enzyme family protein [Actinomycetota bacterium]
MHELPAAVGPQEVERHGLRGTASTRLRRKIELVSVPFGRACKALFDHPRIAELWPEYAVTTHSIIRATVPLMEEAAGRARGDAESDSVAAGVARYLGEHAEEERDHDEWLLQDLELLGVDRSAVLARPPSPTVARLVGAQYYWAFHYHPVAVLGYIALMEGYPPSPRLIEHLVARTGYPREVFRTFAEHGELDPHHRDELDEAIDSLPLTREHEALLGLSAMSSVELLARSIEEVVEGA